MLSYLCLARLPSQRRQKMRRDRPQSTWRSLSSCFSLTKWIGFERTVAFVLLKSAVIFSASLTQTLREMFDVPGWQRIFFFSLSLFLIKPQRKVLSLSSEKASGFRPNPDIAMYCEVSAHQLKIRLHTWVSEYLTHWHAHTHYYTYYWMDNTGRCHAHLPTATASRWWPIMQNVINVCIAKLKNTLYK